MHCGQHQVGEGCLSFELVLRQWESERIAVWLFKLKKISRLKLNSLNWPRALLPKLANHKITTKPVGIRPTPREYQSTFFCFGSFSRGLVCLFAIGLRSSRTSAFRKHSIFLPPYLPQRTRPPQSYRFASLCHWTESRH